MPALRSPPPSHRFPSKLWRVKNHLDCIGHCLNCCGSRMLNFRLLFILRFILYIFVLAFLSSPSTQCFYCLMWRVRIKQNIYATIQRDKERGRQRHGDTVWARQAKKLNVIEFIYGFVCSLFTSSVCECASVFSLLRAENCQECRWFC